MKKMKRLMSSVLSLIVCASSIVNLSLNTSAFYDFPESEEPIITADDGYRLTKNEKLSEIFDFTIYVHDPNQTDKIWPYGKYSFEQPDVILIYPFSFSHSFSMTHLEFRYYICNGDEAEKLMQYLNQNYSNLNVSINEMNNVEIEYPEDATFDFKINLLYEIYDKFGIGCTFGIIYEETINCTYAGDVDNDNLLTADDASYVLEYYAKAQTDKLGEYEESRASELALYGDYDGDGIVDANDASNILAAYSKNQTK